MRARAVVALVGIAFCAGALVTGSLTRSSMGRAPVTVPAPVVGTSGHQAADGRTPSNGAPSVPPVDRLPPGNVVEALRVRHLEVPIEGADAAKWKGSFNEEHGGHRHEAVDVLAPRNTPIHAVDEGVIAKLFVSRAGGLTIYQRDPSNAFMYYYAHLERYGDIHEGDHVARGQVIGYVGTSGNAPPDTPHLHFAIFELGDPAKWWEGTPIDPYEVYAGRD